MAASLAGLQDRRRFERALHDGAQQDLIAISVRIQLLRDAIDGNPSAVRDLLDELEHDTRAALDRVRALAADIYPAILDARGLPDALRELARASSGSVTTSGVGRHAPDVEAAVYFFCRVVAGPGVDVRVSEQPDALRIEVDGAAPDLVARAREVVQGAGSTVRASGDGAHLVPTQSTFAR